ncbi:MAG TPA: hypothetical protein VJ985_06930 [Gammaproteobacteria bacterium]|nr:hypothetical protein [Gammaproteobacteria bacterium]
MFEPIKIPANHVMLYNVAKLKPGYTVEDAELALGEMCEVVKETYPEFFGGLVYQSAGFISEEGSVDPDSQPANEEHLAILTFWESFEAHERSHADAAFKEKFSHLLDYCSDTYEIGYNLLWQGQRHSEAPAASAAGA